MSLPRTRSLVAAALAAALGTAASAASAQQAVTYDANADFVAFENANSGPAVAPVNGVWSYGTRDAVSAADFTGYATHTDAWNGTANIEGFFEPDDAVPLITVNTGSAPISPCCGITPVDPGQIFMHPDPGGQPDMFSVVRFTAPSEGSFTATANFEQLHGNPATTFLVVNGVATDSGNGTSSFTESGNLLAGQTIEFAVGPMPDGNYGATSTGLFAAIEFTPIPEPASLGLLALAGVGLLARHGRRA